MDESPAVEDLAGRVESARRELTALAFKQFLREYFAGHMSQSEYDASISKWMSR